MARFENGTALLFPGQGSQYAGMSRTFYEGDEHARQMIDGITAAFDIKELCFNGPEETLRDTRYSQASIFMASMCIAETLRNNGLVVDAVAGLSLGEFGALCYAGAFDVKTGIQLLTERGRIMADHIPSDSGMAVVMPLSSEKVQEACDEVADIGACQIATFVTPSRTVITGTLAAVDAAGERCKDAGARMVVPISASGAFHSVLATKAAGEFAKALDAYAFEYPTLPLYYNATGTTECEDIKAMEVGQLTQSVEFKTMIENMINDGTTRFICLGPGKTLAGFVKEIAQANDSKAETVTIERLEQAIALLKPSGIVS